MEFTSRQLRALVLVAQHHSFTRAAEALFITPSGLSLLIKELENQLGFRLFDRTTRHVALTEHGSQLVAVARSSLEQLDAATSRIERTAQKSQQTLSIGAGLLMSANILPQAIKEFRTQWPGELRIRLFDAGPTTILEKVRAGTLDIGLGFFRRTPGIQMMAFFRFSFMVIRPDTGAPHRNSTTWSALKGEKLILQADTAPTRQLIDQHLAQAGVNSPSAMALNRLDTVIAMVAAGEGVGVVPTFALPVCRSRNVITSRLINPSVPLDFFQIRNRARKLPAVAEEFTAFLKGYIARWAGRAGVL